MLMDSMLLQALSTRPHLRLKITDDQIVIYNVARTWEVSATTPYYATRLIRDGEAKFGLDVLAAEPSPTPTTQIGLLKTYLSPGTITAKVDGTLTLKVGRKVVWQLRHLLHRIATHA